MAEARNFGLVPHADDLFRDVGRIQADYREHASVEEFLACDDLTSGLHGIRNDIGVFTDALYWDNGAEALVVVFNAAGFPTPGVRPGFNATSMLAGWRRSGRANVLFVHDATLYLSGTMKLAWYSGARDFDYAPQLTRIIQKFMSRAGSRHVVFFGISGGGFAALRYATSFPGSVAVACNAQTSILKHSDTLKDDFLRECWTGETGDRDLSGLIHDVTTLYQRGTANHAHCLVNAQDRHHVEDHHIPLVHAAAEHANVRTLIRNWGSGHTAPPPEYLITFLETLLDALARGEPFPPVWGSALVQSADEVRHLVANAEPTRSQTLVSVSTPVMEGLELDLKGPATGTIEILTELSPEHEQSKDSLWVELVTEVPPTRGVFGTRRTDTGYELSLAAAKEFPAVTRTYLPAENPAVQLRIRSKTSEACILKRVQVDVFGTVPRPRHDEPHAT